MFLDQLVNEFNQNLRAWENHTAQRANFGFRYNEQGRKEMYVIDASPVIDPPAEDVLKAVGEVMEKASDVRVQSG